MAQALSILKRRKRDAKQRWNRVKHKEGPKAAIAQALSRKPVLRESAERVYVSYDKPKVFIVFNASKTWMNKNVLLFEELHNIALAPFAAKGSFAPRKATARRARRS